MIIEPYEGRKWWWHAWHADYLAYYMTYDEVLARIEEIRLKKFEWQHKDRYRLFQLVKDQEALPKSVADAYSHVHLAWRDLDNARDELLMGDFSKIRKCQNAYLTAVEIFKKEYRETRTIFENLHKQECTDNCLWNSDAEELVFYKG